MLQFFSVGFASEAQAAQASEPWNVVAEISYNGVTCHYDLKEESRDFSQTADVRALYGSAKSKRAAADRLISAGLPREASYNYVLPNFKNIVEQFAFVKVDRKDAIVTFDKTGFHYTKGADGVTVDQDKLFDALLKSCGRKIEVQLPLAVDKAVTVADLQKNTVKKASFTTYYQTSGANRCFNVKKAALAINGTTVDVGEEFSFNRVVGPRTAEAGYKTSKVIMDGNYVEGVGGGVCQVSTTLYNALLLSELSPKACQHSLVSSYVAAGFDAMVSDAGADLTFVNDTSCPLYVSASVSDKNKSVTFTVYGCPNVYKVVRESVETREKFSVVEITDGNKYPELVYEDQSKVIVYGSDGVKSKSYLNYYDSTGNLVLRKLIRQNTYKKVDKVIARGTLQRPQDCVEDDVDGSFLIPQANGYMP
ncbi:MAG: VanW family protein [Corallococcus sp.]|nr:VanW family protein [Corallococcus sp.]